MANQLCRERKKGKVKAQAEVIEWQKKKIKNLMATGMQLDPKHMIKAMTQVMACRKGSHSKLTGMKPTGSKAYLGKSKLLEITKGLNGITNPSLTYCYCKDTGDELDNCRKLQQKYKENS